jgi:NAD(P)H-hydrate epimerase
MVVGGSARYVGAPYLAAAAAARSGAGLVILAAPDSVQRVASIQLPEATYTEQAVEPERDPEAALTALVATLESANAVVIGPGLGRSDGAAQFLRMFLEHRATMPSPPPTVVDGDALSLLAEWDGWYSRVGPGLILTPHHGEMGRLLGQSSSTIATSPWTLARECARQWRQVVVLKGPFSVVGQPEGETWVYPHANSALATAGTGDVLAGIVGGLVAQGSPPGEAAALAVWTHAQCAARIVARRRWRSLLASDLLTEIPRQLNRAIGRQGARFE